MKIDSTPRFEYPLHPKFGTVFAPVVLSVELERGKQSAGPVNISDDFSSLNLTPATAALHYGQSIFEGMKAFDQGNQKVAVFRLDLHARRFRGSARKMCMADVSEELFSDCVLKFMRAAKNYVPPEEGHSLYLRPVLFASDNIIKVGVSQKYKFVVIGSVAGDYFGSGGQLRPAKLMVHRKFVRAFPNGYGEAKTAANYALSLAPQAYAAEHGCDQVLYLDSVEHQYIDELGGMNFFAIKGDELLTPVLNGCILDGVTRRSVLQMAPAHGLKPKEVRMSIFDLITDLRAGRVQEIFACGTAAALTPIGELLFKQNDEEAGELIKLENGFNQTMRMRETLMKIQRGRAPAPGKWLFEV